ncbi:MAG: AAA family ATPase [Leptolyngbyaceae bacterium]|nr:AAA family ATPase [Leptolyngbyaceae bacterium]
MLTKLRLREFKNFKNAHLTLGPLTLLIGANASGKSNIRDALRFLHGIGRGYSVADILGEKYVEGGVLQWSGIRGGKREIARHGCPAFYVNVEILLNKERSQKVTYKTLINTGDAGKPPFIEFERLDVIVNGSTQEIFSAKALTSPYLILRLKEGAYRQELVHSISALHQLSVQDTLLPSDDFTEVSFDDLTEVKEIIRAVIQVLSNMRFLDLEPGSMRKPSYPGQVVLGDRGENLSSVLQSICEDPERKRSLIGWLQELTPLDVVDFEFPTDLTGRILLVLVEGNGQTTSAYSASDGTLRFLAMLAALLGPEPAQFYFFEELDNGIHPARLNLLINFIENQVFNRNIQVVSTTHSPQLLRLLSPESLKYASLTYRPPNQRDAHIKRILDIPDAQRVIEKHDIGELHESNWFENALYFAEDQESAE